MLADRLEQIDENLLNQVCLEQWDESATLEFKAMLPQSAPDDKSKQEFLKDVAALANAGGGDVVYGISEVNGKANALLRFRRRLIQSMPPGAVWGNG
jgi:Putative DNA-binding domain